MIITLHFAGDNAAVRTALAAMAFIDSAEAVSGGVQVETRTADALRLIRKTIERVTGGPPTQVTMV